MISAFSFQRQAVEVSQLENSLLTNKRLLSVTKISKPDTCPFPIKNKLNKHCFRALYKENYKGLKLQQKSVRHVKLYVVLKSK